MSPTLLALVIGWAVITVIVIAVSIIAIRGQRSGAENTEVLMPWGKDGPLKSYIEEKDPVDSASASEKPNPHKPSSVDISGDISEPEAAAEESFETTESKVKDDAAPVAEQPEKTAAPATFIKPIQPDQSEQADQSAAAFGAEKVPQADPDISPETRFLRTLKQALAPEVCIWRNLSHQDLIDSDKVVSIEKAQRTHTGLEHVPTLYALYLQDSFTPLCLIHLEKKQSLSEKIIGRKAIDAIRKKAAKDGLPLVRIDQDRQYTTPEVQDLLAFHLPDKLLSPREHEHLIRELGAEKVCPRCSSAMSKKIATRGKYAGTRFWACNSYPDCRQVEVIHREHAEAQSS